jgi:oxygen-dependent protoporphyrinogen oxidase
VHHPLDAAGVVVPSVEGRAMLASTWSSQKWPGRAPDDTALFRVFLGGHGQDDLVHADEAHLVRLAHLELARMLGIEGQPTLTRLDRYVDVMPRYEVGHARRMNTLDARIALLRGVAVAGNFHRGVGIPDSIADGARAAEQLVADLGGTGRSKE